MTVYSTSRDDWRVITVRQPWAWAIQPGGKTVENRGPGAIGWRGAIGCHLMVRAGKGWDDRGRNHPLLGGPPGRRYTDDDPARLPPGHPERPIATGGQYGSTLYALRHVPAHRQPPRPFAAAAVLSVATLADVHSALDDACGCPEAWAELSYPDSTGKLVAPAVHIVLGDIVVLDLPVPDRANGRLGLTRPDVPLLADVLDALGRAGHAIEVAP